MTNRVPFRGVRLGEAGAIPDTDPDYNDDSKKREQRKPDHRFLPAGDDNRRSQERPERAAGIPADLKDGLGKPETAAGTQMRNARRFRVKNRRTKSDERYRDENERKIRSDREQNEADESGGHAEREGERLRMFVRERADEWLEQRSGELIREGDQADVTVVEAQRRFQDRINRRNERLERVVYEMGEAQREKDPEDRRGRRRRRFEIVID